MNENSMNEANQITAATHLYGFIAEAAQQNRFASALNRRFKSGGDDAMMIPMNIRPDDLHFTVSNMKRSHVMGAVIGFEYQAEVMELLDAASPLCERATLCDTVMVREGRLEGALLIPEALKAVVDGSAARRIALVGSTPLATAVSLLLEGYELSVFEDYIEGAMQMQERIGRPLDIHRLGEGMDVDLGGYDLLLDLSDREPLSMVTALPKMNIDLRSPREPSPLRQRCRELEAAYSGYEELLGAMTERLYTYLTKETV